MGVALILLFLLWFSNILISSMTSYVLFEYMTAKRINKNTDIYSHIEYKGSVTDAY